MASLIDFRRVSIPKGDHSTITFSVPYKVFSYYSEEGEKIQHHGNATLTVANASPGERSNELGAKAYKIDVVVD